MIGYAPNYYNLTIQHLFLQEDAVIGKPLSHDNSYRTNKAIVIGIESLEGDCVRGNFKVLQDTRYDKPYSLIYNEGIKFYLTKEECKIKLKEVENYT